MDMEQDPTEETELAHAIYAFFAAFRAGDNRAAFDLLDGATRMAKESGNHEFMTACGHISRKSETNSSGWTSDPKMPAEG